MKWCCSLAVLILVAGCSTTNTQPPLLTPDGSNRVPANSPNTIAQEMANLLHSKEEAKPKPPVRQKVTTKIQLGNALEKYVPKEFYVYANSDIDLNTQIDYEEGRTWFEALGTALIPVDVEMTADLRRKVLYLRGANVTIETVLKRDVPAEFTVFIDNSVSLNEVIKVDHSKPWMEALGAAMADHGLSMTVLVDKNAVVVRPKPTMQKLVRLGGVSDK